MTLYQSLYERLKICLDNDRTNPIRYGIMIRISSTGRISCYHIFDRVLLSVQIKTFSMFFVESLNNRVKFWIYYQKHYFCPSD